MTKQSHQVVRVFVQRLVERQAAEPVYRVTSDLRALDSQQISSDPVQCYVWMCVVLPMSAFVRTRSMFVYETGCPPKGMWIVSQSVETRSV